MGRGSAVVLESQRTTLLRKFIVTLGAGTKGRRLKFIGEPVRSVRLAAILGSRQWPASAVTNTFLKLRYEGTGRDQCYKKSGFGIGTALLWDSRFGLTAIRVWRPPRLSFGRLGSGYCYPAMRQGHDCRVGVLQSFEFLRRLESALPHPAPGQTSGAHDEPIGQQPILDGGRLHPRG